MTVEPNDVDELARRTGARELAWALDENECAVAVDDDGKRFTLTPDNVLFVVLPSLGGVSKVE